MSENKENIEVSDLDSIMSSQSGRRFVTRILNYTNLDDDIYDADTHKHAHNAGRREIGVWLRNELKATVPDRYMMMLKENIDE